MSHPKPSGDQLRQLLNPGHFGGDPGPLPPSDPVGDTAMRLAIDRIDVYDHNPRRSRNSHYDEIKESIRAQGMKQPLVVTRRPGADRYMLRFGGNTRLSILRELFAETREQRFGTADCVFRPWTTETDVLVGHLIENETRGELSFIDKARAVHDAGKFIESERNAPVSKHQLAGILKERGYRIDHAQVYRYEYTLKVLVDSIPQAFEAGIGSPQVRRLRQLDLAAERVWQQRQLGTDEVFRALFKIALTHADDRNWNFERARRAVETAIANRAAVDVRLVTLELGAELDGSGTGDNDDIPAERFEPGHESCPEPEATEFGGIEEIIATDDPPPLRAPSWEPPPIAPVPRSRPESPAGASRPAASSARPVMAAPLATPESRNEGLFEPPTCEESESEPEDTRTDGRIEPVAALDLSDPNSIDEHRLKLMRQLRLCGQTYARHAGLESCIRTDGSPWIRLGYLVIDFPDARRCSESSRDERQRQFLAWSWWTLVLCCDLCRVNDHLVRQYPDPDDADEVRAKLYGAGSQFVTAWRDLNAVTLAIRQTVGHADPFGYSDYVDAASPELWEADRALRQAYREIRTFGAQTGVDIVGDPIDGDAS